MGTKDAVLVLITVWLFYCDKYLSWYFIVIYLSQYIYRAVLVTCWSCQLSCSSHCVHCSLTPWWTRRKWGSTKEMQDAFILCRWVYSLLAGTVATAADVLYPLLSWLTQRTQPLSSSKCHCFLGGAHIPSPHTVASDQAGSSWCTCAVLKSDLSCYIVIIYKMWGKRASTHHLG